jgi:hypothetical protein
VGKLILIDVDALFGFPSALSLPRCPLRSCDKDEGQHQDPNGFCTRHKWCVHAKRSSELTKAYRDPQHLKTKEILQAVPVAIQKLHQNGWQLSLWTTRPQSQSFQIIEALKRAEIWDLALPLSATDTLLNTFPSPSLWDYSIETAKLTLWETVYTPILNQFELPIAAIEADELEANVLKNYGGDQLTVKMSPSVWIEILAIDPDSLGLVLQDSVLSTQSC